MGKGRLEAFSDGVIAIIITIMVLEMKVPHGTDWAALQPLVPVFFSYVLSFIYVGIYWNNHHHMMHTVTHVSGSIMWANLNALFWMSLMPFATAWLGENHGGSLPTALYGFVLSGASIGYVILQNRIIACHGGANSQLAHAVGRDHKGKLSILGYAAGIGLAFVDQRLSDVLYVAVALMWLIPDTRISSLQKAD